MRHEALLASNPRMALQVKNLARLDKAQKTAALARAAAIRNGQVGTIQVAAAPIPVATQARIDAPA